MDNGEKAVDLSLVLGYIAVKDQETVEKKVAVLAKLGFTNEQIATICGSKANAIRAIKSKLNKGSKNG